VGVGGMGEVHRAWDKALGRIVAVKIIKEMTEEAVARFEREAQLAARLSHPNIATIFGVGEHDGRRYIAMQFIEGSTLEDCGAELRTLVSAMDDAARAVAYAHANGVIHRDLNPRNIMLDASGRGYVTDFGIARGLTAGSTVTQTGMVLGTPAFMSPEQASGDPLGPATDVYSLGATLYSVATQSAPHYGDSPAQILRRVREEEPVPPRRLNPRIDRALQEIILHAMEKEPGARYSTAVALAADLRRWHSTGKIRGRPWLRRLRPRAAVRRRGMAVGALAAAALLGAGIWWLTHPTPPAPPRVDPLAAARQVVSDFAALVDPTPQDYAEEHRRLESALAGLGGRHAAAAGQLRCEFDWHAGRREEALSSVDAAIAADRANPISHLWRARILLRMYLRERSDWERQVSLASMIGGLFGANEESRKKLVEMKRLVTETREALSQFVRRAVRAEPEKAFAEGIQQFVDSKNEAAEERLLAATESSYLSRDAYLVLSIVRTFLGKYDQAEKDLLRARGERGDYALVRSMLAVTVLVDILKKMPGSPAETALEQHLRVLLEQEPDHQKWTWWEAADRRVKEKLEEWIQRLRPS
jgi:predicted Ser/Thr protein kinase/tetratricopeptide (TPR) repeat protein